MLITRDEIDMMPVRALSWKQPYATLMLYGKAETRVWSTPYRGLVLICSSYREYTYNEIMATSGAAQYSRIKKVLADKKHPVLSGHALAIGRLHNCKSMSEYALNETAEEINDIENKTYVRFFSDLWVLEFKDVRPIQPIPWKGSQKWRGLTDYEKKQIVLL